MPCGPPARWRTSSLAVANREWSPAAALAGEVARIRVALDGVRRALAEHADTAGSDGSQARGARLARLGESLTPVLCDLVLRVLAAEAAQPSTGGQEALERRAEAGGQAARGLGPACPRPRRVVPAAVRDRPAGTMRSRTSTRTTWRRSGKPCCTRPRQEMWQLCSPGDLGALNVAAVPEVVRFASRLNKDALGGDTAGRAAGVDLVRLVRGTAPPGPAAPRLRLLELG